MLGWTICPLFTGKGSSYLRPVMAQNERDIEQNALKQNLSDLIRLRGVAFYGQLFTIGFTYYVLGIDLDLFGMLGVSFILMIANLIANYRLVNNVVLHRYEVFFGLILDVLALSAQLWYSGGVINPFISLYLLPIILGAVLLRPFEAWFIAAFCFANYILLSFSFKHVPLHETRFRLEGFDLHLHGMMIAFVLQAFLSVFFITKVVKNLKERDQQLLILKEKAAEQAEFARMGLLSAGAAHEMGSPLTTLSVILSDWQRFGVPKTKNARDTELNTLVNEIERCKKTLSHILKATNHTRSEGGDMVWLKGWIKSLMDEWHLRHGDCLITVDFTGEDKHVLSDLRIAQCLICVLDNGYEAAKTIGNTPHLKIIAQTTHTELKLIVSDNGPGLSEAAMINFAKPFESSKTSDASAHGRGMGLFIARQALKSMDGDIGPINGPQETGATLCFWLPLSSLSPTSKMD